MGKPYRKELEAIPHTYEWVNDLEVDSIANTLKYTSHLPLISIGSGGSYTAAELHVTLHRLFFNTIGMACTPMELPRLFPSDSTASLWFMSASGSNIDIHRAFKHAALLEPRAISVLVGCKESKLSELVHNFEYANIFEYILPSGRDGFLATNSLFGFSILMYRAYCSASQQQDKLPHNTTTLLRQNISDFTKLSNLENSIRPLWEMDVLHVLYSPGLKSIAVDIESKFVEAGLGVVLVSDLRNFAHGRHHWFAKNTINGGVLFLTHHDDEDLGSKTLHLLPKEIPKFQITLINNNGRELLAGLLLSFYFSYWKGLIRNIDPGKPGVPQYGSKIYRLTAKSGFISSLPKMEAAVRRKVILGPKGYSNKDKWDRAYKKFTRKLAMQKIGGIVLDYDGTVIDPRLKGSPPSKKICDELVRLMKLGVKIGFATGRGKSIRKELQKKGAIPKTYWDQVLLGYYNGSEIGTLGNKNKPISNDSCVDELIGIEKLLNENLLIQSLCPEITKRLHQITVVPNMPISETLLWRNVQEQLSYNKDISAKVTSSSHSIDIITRFVTKLAVVKQLETYMNNNEIVLTIGDRGRWPGNDTDLLSTPFSLSVDEVSLAEDRCWNLCPAGLKGPQGTLSYLQKIQRVNGRVTFK